jgi:hypothetical protein
VRIDENRRTKQPLMPVFHAIALMSTNLWSTLPSIFVLTKWIRRP